MGSDSPLASVRPAPSGFILLIALLALAAAGKAVLYDTLDPDCFWHLRVADELMRQGIGPIVDTLSYASRPQPWTPYSWLAELGMGWIWQLGGYRAAVAVQALMQGSIILLIAMSSLELQKQSPSAQPRYLATSLATAIAAFLSLAYFSFRPVTLAILLLALCAWLLLRDRRLSERSAAVWLIIPLTALLTNIHLFAIFVPAAVAALLLGALIETSLGLKQSQIAPQRTQRDAENTLVHAFPSAFLCVLCGKNDLPPSQRAMRYLLMLIGTALAYLATPMLPGMLAATLRYPLHDTMVASPIIAEMQSFWHGPMGKVSAALVLLIAACAIAHPKRLRAGEWLLLLGSAALLFKLGRFAPLFALIAGPALAVTLPKMQDRLLSRPALCALLAIVVAGGIYRIAAAFPTPAQPLSAWLNRNGPDAPGYPCSAAEFVDRRLRPSTGRLINEFSWGGYLAWRLGDHYQVLLDGRTQVYPPSLWQATYLGNDRQRRDFLATLRADAAVLPAGKSHFRQDLTNLGWYSVYHDDRAEVMLPPKTSFARIE